MRQRSYSAELFGCTSLSQAFPLILSDSFWIRCDVRCGFSAPPRLEGTAGHTLLFQLHHNAFGRTQDQVFQVARALPIMCVET